MKTLRTNKPGTPRKPGKPPVKKPVERKSLKEKVGSPARSALPLTEITLPTEAALNSDFREVLRELWSDVKTCEEGYRRGLREAIAGGCKVAAFLEKHEEQWRAFCKMKVWAVRTSKPNPDKRSQVLRFVLVAISGRGKEGAKRASKWHSAVGPLIKKGVKPADIPDAIKKAGGIEALAGQNAKRKKTERAERPNGQPPLRKQVASKINRHDAKVIKGPLPQESFAVTLQATLKGEGQSLLNFPIGSHATLTVKILGRIKGGFKLAVLNAERIAVS